MGKTDKPFLFASQDRKLKASGTVGIPVQIASDEAHIIHLRPTKQGDSKRRISASPNEEESARHVFSGVLFMVRMQEDSGQRRVDLPGISGKR